jgi:RHS repeat-associated protein
LRFAGQYFDSETGLHYNYWRFYDPKLGRYLRADPIGIEKGRNHLFTYVSNNPINASDYYGLEATSNGCGPNDWRNKFVPNRPLGLINFTSACNTHDKCYATCGADKGKCDQNFYDDMRLLCYRKYGWNSVKPAPPIYGNLQNTCDSLAHAYFQAVSRYGQGPYNEGQKGCCSKDKK